ncbi:isopentenyl phosphate kinase [Halorientalis regularis]|jgi:isopentenyl phosphate kinase|uniref:Isopentenyl phosphate kinase n=1 Tax=Halorientalis regularis TaxID=660518 RepID=A0A1G7N445_9EURY|nr:isopentenyl phosphate kinase [Halorientalis regularis]SDF68100.1 isopentenyl phosphate kinase [Halorientalis regularis]
MTVVVKLGGSVVTEKDEPETLDEAAIERAARAVASADEEVVVVHGGGSFGHHYATRHGVSRTDGTADALAVREIHGAMKRLNDAMVEALADAGVTAVPVHPLSAGARDGEGQLDLPTGQVRTMLGEGFVPVLHGDVVAHVGAGATIVSGDELVVALATGVDADRVGLCSAVPGVLDADDDVIDRIDAFEDVAAVLGGSDAADVTGGMAAKVRTLLDLDTPASIFALADLRSFFEGERPGTLVAGGDDES